MIKEDPIAHYWLAAATTGYALVQDWVRWADQVIGTTDAPEHWIVDVALAKDLGAFRAAIKPQVELEDDLAGKVIPIADAQIGFYYLSFLAARLSLSEFFEKASQVCETGVALLSPEELYSFMNRVDQRGNDTLSSENALSEVESFFADYLRIANEQWNSIWSYSN